MKIPYKEYWFVISVIFVLICHVSVASYCFANEYSDQILHSNQFLIIDRNALINKKTADFFADTIIPSFSSNLFAQLPGPPKFKNIKPGRENDLNRRALDKNINSSGNEISVGDSIFPTGANPFEKIKIAVNAIGLNEAVLRLPRGNYKINPSENIYEIPSNITLHIEAGALLEPAFGKTLIIKGELKAGTYQIFSGLGNISFENKYPRAVYPQWWGAKGDGSTDDTNAFCKAVTSAAGKTKVVLPPGTYLLSINKITHLPVTGNIEIVGKGIATLKAESSNSKFFLDAPVISSPKLITGVNRKSSLIKIDKTADIMPGDIIRFDSDTVVETGWKFKKADINVVKEVLDAQTIKLLYPLNWEFSVNELGLKITHCRPSKILINNVSFQTHPNGYFFFITNCAGVNISNCKIFSEVNYGNNAGLLLSGCVNVTCQKMFIENISYGVVIGTVRNFLSENTWSAFCRHPYVPTNWSDGVTIDNLVGYYNEATMDSHPCFNVTYQNIRAYDGKKGGFSNLRCAGGTIKNSYFYNPNLKGAGYFHNVTFVDRTIYNGYDFIAENVIWDTPNAEAGEFKFGPEFGRRGLLVNVRAKNLQAGVNGKNNISEILLDKCGYDNLYTKIKNVKIKSE